MKRDIRGIVILLCWACYQLAQAQPQTPTVYLNDKFRLVQLARGQRANLRFDLRPIRGEHLKVLLYSHEDLESPVREWLFHKSHGQERLDFKDLPRNVYRMIAYASNEEGQPLATRAPYLHIEYGGWRAWEKFEPPVETVDKEPPAFEDVDVATNLRNRDVAITLNPPAIVIRPGGEQSFSAAFRNMEPERLEWTLVGDGELKAIDDMNYIYRAPQEQVGTKLFRIEVTSPSHPELKGGATILVTNADPDTLNRIEN